MNRQKCLFESSESIVSSLTPRDQRVILRCHNHYRSLLAKGKAKNKEGINMPSAANMYKMKYSKTLESSAKEWAEKCTISHSHGKYGENLFMSTDKKLSDSPALRQACKDWWAELTDYGMDQSLVLDNEQFSKGIGHWSQMAWAKTSEIGCARATCPNSEWETYVVCQYNPP
uniref:SCP domain-containing protein n=1 Tax=Meloidogyne hapla TaxID=6305 RepID=A0A1I8BXP7_MELHA